MNSKSFKQYALYSFSFGLSAVPALYRMYQTGRYIDMATFAGSLIPAIMVQAQDRDSIQNNVGPHIANLNRLRMRNLIDLIVVASIFNATCTLFLSNPTTPPHFILCCISSIVAMGFSNFSLLTNCMKGFYLTHEVHHHLLNIAMYFAIC